MAPRLVSIIYMNIWLIDVHFMSFEFMDPQTGAVTVEILTSRVIKVIVQ